MSTGPATATEVASALAHVRDVCARLDPVAVPLHEVTSVFDSLAELDRLAGGAVLRMAARYEQAGTWQRNGSRSAEDDIARKTGTGTGQARRKLRTSRRLRNQRHTDDSLRSGHLSPDQAAEVSDAAAESPQDEQDLLESARTEPLHRLREKAAAARARADRDRDARRRRLHSQRCARRWDDADGMANLLLRLPAESMSEVDAALKPRIDRAFARARTEARFEPVEAYTADVIRDLLLGGEGTGDLDRDAAAPGRRSQAVRPDKKVIALIDVAALNRGTVERGDTCEIAGVGPVSVSAVRALLADAFLSIVIHDGEDIRNVTHLGRQVTARQRTALEARGSCCEVCGNRSWLDIDHNEGWTLTKTTTVDDLSWLCRRCHDLKTRHHLRLAGPPNHRHLVDRTTGRRWHPPPERAESACPVDRGRAVTDPSRAPDHDAADQGELFALLD